MSKKDLGEMAIKKHLHDVSFKCLKYILLQITYTKYISDVLSLPVNRLWLLNIAHKMLTSWWHLEDLLLQYLKRSSDRQIGLDILDVSALSLICVAYEENFQDI